MQRSKMEEEGVGWAGIPMGRLVAENGPADLDEKGERRLGQRGTSGRNEEEKGNARPIEVVEAASTGDVKTAAAMVVRRSCRRR